MHQYPLFPPHSEPHGFSSGGGNFVSIDEGILSANVIIEKRQYNFFELRKLNTTGELLLTPPFPRHIVWTVKQQSRFIESLFMNIPLPSFYFSKSFKGVLTVLDGLQRLNSIFTFMNDKLFLKGLQFFPHMENYRFSSVERSLQAKIEKYQISSYIIGPDLPEHIKSAIIYSINCNGTPFNNQEKRYILYRGQATQFLEDVSQSTDTYFAQMMGNRIKKSRMQDQELILTFLAIYMWRTSPDKEYSTTTPPFYHIKTLASLLDQMMHILNSLSKTQLAYLKQIFDKSMNISYQLYKDSPFLESHHQNNPANKLLFLTLSYCFAKLDFSLLQQDDKIELSDLEKQFLFKEVGELLNQPFVQEALNRFPSSLKKLQDYFNQVEPFIYRLQESLC